MHHSHAPISEPARNEDAQAQHDRFVRKLREAEIEASTVAKTFSQQELDSTMEKIFARWDA